MKQLTKDYSHGDERPCGCHESQKPSGCHEGTPPPVTCCKLVCFERPNYFCGHLLTDEDLALEQRYTVEKNKLKNRTLQGHGVVCGLELSCDSCAGYVRVGSGYAIDDCGNDLVVCEPRRFNVVDALRKKGWILEPPSKAPCDPDDAPPDCEVKQCFYVTACYEEEFSDYSTPFEAGCNSGPQQCLPTRVREKVRLEVTDKLPARPGYGAKLKARIEKCFEDFTKGHIGYTIKQKYDTIKEALSGAPSNREGEDPYCKLFCLLKNMFLQHMKLCPDRYSCGLYTEVDALTCPARSVDDYGYRLKKAYCDLIELMLRYLYDCVINASLFDCPEPCESHCVVLGTVEIYGGNLVRVCNTPRWYVWSFANLLPLLYNYILTQAPRSKPPVYSSPDTVNRRGEETTEHEHKPESDPRCCADYPNIPNACEAFIEEFRENAEGRKFAALSPLMATEAFLESLLQSFNYANPNAISPSVFSANNRDGMNATAKNLGFSVQEFAATAAVGAADPILALLSKTLVYRGSDIIVSQPFQNGGIAVTSHLAGILSQAGGEEARRIAVETNRKMEEALAAKDRKIEELENQIKNTNVKLNDFIRNHPNPNG